MAATYTSSTSTSQEREFFFGADVDDSVRQALTRDPDFVHPEFVGRPAWIIRDGSPVAVPVVGRLSRALRRPLLVVRDRHIVYTVDGYFWTRADAARAQAALDRSLDL